MLDSPNICFSCKKFFLLVIATKMVAVWSTEYNIKLWVRSDKRYGKLHLLVWSEQGQRVPLIKLLVFFKGSVVAKGKKEDLIHLLHELSANNQSDNSDFFSLCVPFGWHAQSRRLIKTGLSHSYLRIF